MYKGEDTNRCKKRLQDVEMILFKRKRERERQKVRKRKTKENSDGGFGGREERESSILKGKCLKQ